LILFALAACWFLFFNELRGEWQVNPQYNYGYVVPLLGAALLWRRWPDRPAVVPGKNSVLTAAIICLLLLQLPLNVVWEANPEWRLLYWINGFQVIGLTALFLYRGGGGAWVRHFGPPILFMLIAVPWPMETEQFIIQGLMRFVAGLTVDVAGFLSIPALQHGNLIEVGTGIVGIDEACSGVRSLQSALMLSLFLGELYRFSSLRRLALIGASLLLVLLANLTRTSFLVWTAAHRGLHQMAAWHDTVGLVIMLIVLPSLMGLAYLMQPKNVTVVAPPSPASPSRSAPKTPRWIGISILGWLLAVQVATESWYRYHERELIPNAQWSVGWPVENPGFKKTSLPENSLAILRCSDSEAGTWQDDADNQWSAFLLRWNPGKNSEQLARGHRPDICFPAAGARLADDFGRVTLDAHGIAIPFRHQSFEAGTKLMHVFYCLWSDQISAHGEASVENGSYSNRFLAVMEGKRNLGQKVLEIVVQGPNTSEEAVALLQQQLPSLIRSP
jgi:exosortase